MAKKVLIIIQARLNSSRLPNKVLKKIGNDSVIELLVKRLLKSKLIDQVILATTKEKEDDKLIDVFKKLKLSYFRGSTNNVLSRFLKAAKKFKGETIVRITGDCPLIDIRILDKVLLQFKNNNLDYSSNISPPTFPDGFDVEVFSFKALKKAYENATSKYDKEHVTSFIRNNPKFKKINLINKNDFSNIGLTLDNNIDFKTIKNIFDYFYPNIYFSYNQIMNLKNKKPKLFLNNSHKRNEGSKLGKGQKLWLRAKNIIPGGNMLISKRSEFFLPTYWPSYYQKAKGVRIWDLDNNILTDMSLMGVGTNILGYSYAPVDNEVIKVAKNGNMSTLNCPEEVALAEILLDMNPWSDMVKFARTGAEANAIGIRLARSFTDRDNIAICGYHGWHDWYLAANLKNKNTLDNHLLSGLYSKGVPKKLKNSIYSFQYNDFEALFRLVKEKNIGVIKMEVIRNQQPQNNFLDKVRDLANKNKIILIFDECTSGFRETFGGIYQKYNVEPDIAIYGKAMGNGYAITAVVGKGDIMQEEKNTFISSTFWTERIGYVAALKTLKEMKKINSWKIISSIGTKITNKWIELANKNNLSISTSGISSLPNFRINSKNWPTYKTFITQEMLKEKYLASNSIYVCIEHSDKQLNKYFRILDKLFQKISIFESNKSLLDILESDISQTSFTRLN